MTLKDKIFNIHDDNGFRELALELFHFQYTHNAVYHDFVNALGVDPFNVTSLKAIPFLPVSFFKERDVVCGNRTPEAIFLSSGTTGMVRSRHLVADVTIYNESLLNGFRYFYGDPNDFEIFSLAPSKEENPHSSLGYMLNALLTLQETTKPLSYLNDFDLLEKELKRCDFTQKNVILFGLTAALLEFGERQRTRFPGLIIIETGGMKGKRREMVREELHDEISRLYGVDKVHSEYGMTELLSQAYSKGNGLFSTPPWMKILLRDIDDPLTIVESNRTGGINIIDLANLNSCSFIATMDLGRIHSSGQFEVIGRYDNSDLRGCNLLIV